MWSHIHSITNIIHLNVISHPFNHKWYSFECASRDTIDFWYIGTVPLSLYFSKSLTWYPSISLYIVYKKLKIADYKNIASLVISNWNNFMNISKNDDFMTNTFLSSVRRQRCIKSVWYLAMKSINITLFLSFIWTYP